MKCSHYERTLTNINGIYSDQFILAKVQLFSLSFLYIEEEPSPARSTPWGAYRSSTSCGALPPSMYLQSHIFTHLLTHSFLLGRSMVVGHIPIVHTCSLICQSHRHDNPAFFTELGTTYIYILYIYIYMYMQTYIHIYVCVCVEYSTTGHSDILHLWSNGGRMVTPPCINWAHDCLLLNLSDQAHDVCTMLHVTTQYKTL